MPYHKTKEGDMIRTYRFVISIIMALLALSVVAGCGSGNKEGAASPTATPTKVGSESCINTCHAVTKDITGNTISTTWANTTHNTAGGVQCEDCHGAASQHWGVGPIPSPNPQAAQCNACHGKTGFNATLHANSNPFNGSNFSSFTGPDKFFFQGDAGKGPASIRNVPEFLPDGKTPVTHAQHIQECSVCHNPNQRFNFDINGNLVKPNPNAMPDPPNITCAGCHDAHQPEQKVKIAQRANPVGYPVFRQFIVNSTGEQNFAADPALGNETPVGTATRMAASLYQPNGAVQADGSVDATKVVGRNNEINPERLCASCHTVGKYLYSKLATHQTNVYAQYLNSGHGDRSAAPFAEFSANPPAYTNEATGKPYEVGTHAATYPFDMALSAAGTTASTSQNAGYIPAGSTSVANAYSCYKCHNGVGSLAWQDNVQGTPAAPVIFGDVSVTCITCHDPHADVAGQSKNTRRPVMVTNYSTSSITIQGNVFLDKTPIPLDKTGNSTICVFCHQGRESGLTLYATKLAAGKKIAGAFFNPHYLGTAAMLWGVNGYEYAGKSYSVNAAHQGANCTTCHMANPTADNQNGGHTWSPNVATCNTSTCHGGFGPVGIEAGSKATPDVDKYRAAFDTNNYTGDAGGASLSIADSIRVLEQKIIAVFASKGIVYDDLSYPYFFPAGVAHTFPNAFTAWTPATYKAAFNLSFAVKGLPSGAASQANVPNASAAVHNYKYIIQLLQDGYADLTGAALPGAFRPVGTRPATVYGPNQ